MAQDELVLLGVVDEVEASIWRDALEKDGIQPFIRNRDPLAAAGVPLLFGRYEVFVLQRDERRARWVVGEAVEPDLQPPPVEPELETAAPE